MQSHWDTLPTIRVVDVGYLLAGQEPERTWRSASPLVQNFYNLIREKTGAVTARHSSTERDTITQAEFQTLKAEYGEEPALSTNISERIWPWGAHHTELLGHLDAAAQEFWVHYDPANVKATAPKNYTVANWLETERKVSHTMAVAMATILRIDGLPTGPRK